MTKFKDFLKNSVGPVLVALGIVMIQSYDRSEFTWIWALGYIMLMIGLQMVVLTMMVTASVIIGEILRSFVVSNKDNS